MCGRSHSPAAHYLSGLYELGDASDVSAGAGNVGGLLVPSPRPFPSVLNHPPAPVGQS